MTKPCSLFEPSAQFNSTVPISATLADNLAGRIGRGDKIRANLLDRRQEIDAPVVGPIRSASRQRRGIISKRCGSLEDYALDIVGADGSIQSEFLSAREQQRGLACDQRRSERSAVTVKIGVRPGLAFAVGLVGHTENGGADDINRWRDDIHCL